MRKVTLDNGLKAQAFVSYRYAQAEVNNVEEYLKKQGNKPLPTKGHMNPLNSNYLTEIDISQELQPQYTSYCQSLIGILMWIVELGRVDICVELSMMSSHVALPRQGHLNQVFCIFGYLKKHHNAEMVLDPTDTDINMSQFENQDWSQTIYGEWTDAIPPNVRLAYGRGMCMTVWVYSDHAGESLTRRSRTGYPIFRNVSPIYWFSKKVPII